MKFSNIFLLAATLSVGSAHSIMQAFNGNKQGDGLYMPSYDGFIGDVTSDSLACNGAPNSGFTFSSNNISVVAGSTVTGAWLHTLTSTGPDSTADNKVIDSSHKGPVMAYMKKVSDATQNPSAGPGDGWFKISEAGLISSTEWAVDTLITAGGIQSVTIPSCIENGDYLLRFELIALHSAYAYPGVQFYMECAQITITGGTGTATPSTVAIPGVYKSTDPGVTVNIYNSQGKPYPSSGSYTIPGPSVFTCPSGSGSSSSGSSVVSSASSPSSSALATTMVQVVSPTSAVATTSTAASSSGSGSGSVAHWGQCGGSGYTGATTCADGLTCTELNTWYSQCL